MPAPAPDPSRGAPYATGYEIYVILAVYGGESVSPALWQRDNLAGIHDVLRVERALDRSHGGECRVAVLGDQIFHLALTNPMLPCAGQDEISGRRAQRRGTRRHGFD